MWPIPYKRRRRDSLISLVRRGGADEIILGCATLQASGRCQSLLRRAAQLGEASFFVFVLQFYVYWVLILPFNTRLPMPSLWPIYLLVTFTGIAIAAFQWQGRGCNRFLTVGYRRLCERIDAEAGIPVAMSVK